MTKALIIGDLHLTDDVRRPSGRRAGYEQEILDKLSLCVKAANKLEVPIIFAGDIFHLKPGSKNSHRLVQRLHSILVRCDKEVWLLPGNHDMVGDRLDSLDRQPFGALCRMEKMHMLIGEDTKLPGIAGVPYISEFDGGNWKHALTETWGYFEITEPELIITHAPIFPPGQEPGVYASISAAEWASYWIGVPATYYGHIHDCHGVFMAPNKTMEFCNQGALSRGSLHESTIARKPAVTLWDGTNFTRIEVPHKASEEVFLLDEAQLAAANKASATEFAEVVGTVKIPTLTIESIYASIRSEVSDKRVLDIIEKVLEG